MDQFGKDTQGAFIGNTSIPHNSKKQTIGVILGKFMPPHRGHEYLAQFASSFVDKLWIFVCSLPNEPIPGELRYQWMKALFPLAEVVHIQEVNPAANRQQEGAQRIWAQAVRSHILADPDYVFASESYGWDFANELGATFIPVDPSRDQFPISGSELREKPFRNWHFIPTPVRSYFVKEVVIKGNKDEFQLEEVIQKAALLLNTLYVPTYDDFYQKFSGTNRQQLPSDAKKQAQAALINSLKTQARCFLLRAWPEAASHGECTPDLIIRLLPEKVGERETLVGNVIKTAQTESQIGAKIELEALPNTAAHAIRDVILDYYKELF